MIPFPMKVEKVMMARHMMCLGLSWSARVAPLNLTHQQFLVLSRITEQGSLSQKDLCDKMLYEKSNVSRIIKRLYSLGFVQIEPDRKDARRQVISPTDQGSLTVVTRVTRQEDHL